MSQIPAFELVSFDLCPYVQRSVITLKHKKVDFKITYIDLANPPEWFNKTSPLGKVPLLLVRGSASTGSSSNSSGEPVVVFDSAVINEYIDEVTPPSVLPRDPLLKARERAWVAVSGELLMSLYTIMTSEEKTEVDEAKQELWDVLSRVEEVVSGGNYFSSNGFSLADAAFAPVFMRLLMLKPLRDDAHWKQLPKTRKWADALLALPEVRESVIPEFKQKYVSYLKKQESPLANEII
jgi:glutathione S-transferase